MARNFIGSATHRLDAKGRVSLPSDYREVLRADGEPGKPDGFVLIPAAEDEPAHIAMTPSGHAELIAMLTQEVYDSPEEEQATRMRYIGNARPVSVEDGGRFVLSKDLRDMLGLTDQVRFVGDGGTFQIWEPGAHDARFGPAAAAKPKKLRLAGIGQ